jgi:AraC-like DNA-binding protein
MDVTEILEALGFYSVHYFSKCFKEKEYITPLEFRKKVGNNIYMQLDDKFDNNTQL